MYTRSPISPAYNAVAVTPNDSTDLAIPARSLYVGTTGDVEVHMSGDSENPASRTAVVFPNVQGGSVLPVMVDRVLLSNTTATGIVALLD